MILVFALSPQVPISVERIQMRHAECGEEDMVDGKGKESLLLRMMVGQDDKHHCFDEFVGRLHAVSTGSRMDSFPQVNDRPIWTAFPEKAMVHERFCWLGMVQGFGFLEGGLVCYQLITIRQSWVSQDLTSPVGL